MSALGDHAIAELTAIGAPAVIKDPLILIVGTFADVTNPELNWPVMRTYLDKLLDFQPLSQLTSDPDEWRSRFNILGNRKIWQNKRQLDAWTKDPAFMNYFLMSEASEGGTVSLYPTIPHST